MIINILEYLERAQENYAEKILYVERSSSQHMVDYIFPVLRYHDRWKKLKWEDIRKLRYHQDFMHGQYPVYKSVEIEARDEVDESSPAEKENSDAWFFYKKAIKYCQDQGTEVVVVNMPDERWTYGRYLTAKRLTEEKGAAYIDFNMGDLLQEMDIDWKHDFYDPHHLNPVGAQKTTKYLGDYLVEHNPDLLSRQCSKATEKSMNTDLKRYKIYLKKFEDRILKNDLLVKEKTGE